MRHQRNVHATDTAVAAVARVHSVTSDFKAVTKGFCLQAFFNCEYIGLHMLWQDVFLQDVFATLSKDDMTNSQKNC